MAPEYAMRGQFSVKSDVFSFGVLVLEIVSGKKNTEFYQTNLADDLLSYVSTIKCKFFLMLIDTKLSCKCLAKQYFTG